MGLEEKLPSGFLLTTVETLAGYFRKNSLWPATFGLACCAIEMMSIVASRLDIARFGFEAMRASPRQADHIGGIFPEELVVAGDLRVGLLRDRDDGHRRTAIRHRTLWHGAVFGHTPTG